MARGGSVRDFPFPKHPNFGQCGWCKWCGGSIPEVIDGKRSTQRMWHPACANEFQLHTRAGPQYDHLVGRDGERCAVCPPDALVPMRWQRGEAQMLMAGGWAADTDWGRELWTREELQGAPRSFDPATGQVINPDAWMLHGGQCAIERVVALEVDHRVPLWSVADLPAEERRWYFGPGNLWLLCPTHHKEKTKREAAERGRHQSVPEGAAGPAAVAPQQGLWRTIRPDARATPHRCPVGRGVFST
jgi:5-methylcytosine-specific restriction endonuclease McrA